MPNLPTTNDKTQPRKPNAIDVHVGSKVRLRRQILKLSQEKLGDELGVTCQQVLKYERGSNRIGASRLWKLSLVLGVPTSFFFDGLEGGLFQDEEASEETVAVIGFINSTDGVSFAKVLSKIPTLNRRKLLELARVMAGEAEGDLLPLT